MNPTDYGKIYQRRIDWPLGGLLALGYLVTLLATADVGVCRDETYYFHAGEQYITWVHRFASEVWQGRPLQSVTPQEIRRYWNYNWEHPPLAKLSIGASWWFFTRTWNPLLQRLKMQVHPTRGQPSRFAQGWNQFLSRFQVSSLTAFRFAGMLWGSLIILLVYLWGVRVWNRRVGIFAAIAMMLLPRFFFHAHLAAFDVPVTALWLLVAYAFWRSLQTPIWGLLCGLAFGLALATKHNAWILPVPLGLYWLWQNWNRYRLKILHDGTYVVRFPPLPTAVYTSLFLGPLVLFLLWPLLWPANLFELASWQASFKQLGQYISFHLQHNHYDAYYFGVLHMEPPFPMHFPFVMTAITFPVVTLILCLGGIWFTMRQQRLGTHVIWWGVRLVRGLWSLLRPILLLILTLTLLIPAIVFGVLWLAFKILEQLGRIVPGGVGVEVRRGFAWLGAGFGVLSHDIREWNRWLLEEQTEPAEYKPRPVGPADKTGLFWLINAFIPIAIIALPSTPIFGGTKHWMPAWPFLALLAGVGFERVCVAMFSHDTPPQTSLRQHIWVGALGVLFLAPALIGTIRSHPHQLAYYNTLVGGPRGSANWKMQRTFWAPHTRQVLPWINQTWGKSGQPQQRVDFHDSNAYWTYRNEGFLSPNIGEWRITEPHAPSHAILFVHQKWLHNQLYHTLSILGARAPSVGVYLDGVPLITVWEKNRHPIPVWW